jgi:hypothetical protein
MKTMGVGDIKTNFPYLEEKIKEREIGILDGKMNIKFKDGFEMTTEELLEML